MVGHYIRVYGDLLHFEGRLKLCLEELELALFSAPENLHRLPPTYNVHQLIFSNAQM